MSPIARARRAHVAHPPGTAACVRAFGAVLILPRGPVGRDRDVEFHRNREAALEVANGNSDGNTGDHAIAPAEMNTGWGDKYRRLDCTVTWQDRLLTYISRLSGATRHRSNRHRSGDRSPDRSLDRSPDRHWALDRQLIMTNAWCDSTGEAMATSNDEWDVGMQNGLRPSVVPPEHRAPSPPMGKGVGAVAPGPPRSGDEPGTLKPSQPAGQRPGHGGSLKPGQPGTRPHRPTAPGVSPIRRCRRWRWPRA